MGPVIATSRLTVLMFTDIVDSTHLKSALGAEAYFRRLMSHDALFKGIVASYPGAEVVADTGDGFFARFSAVSDAVNAALRFQDALSKEGSPTQPLRSRVGMHVGKVTELGWKGIEGSKVVGVAADLASRVMGLAEGGQILMTGQTFAQAQTFVQEHPHVEADQQPELKWMSHGRYKLKGMAIPVEVHEVGAEGIAPFKWPEESPKARRWAEGDEVQFWQKPFVQDVLPFVSSVCLHVGLIAAVLMAAQVINVAALPMGRDQVIIPEATMVGEGPGGGVDEPGLGGARSQAAGQDILRDIPRETVGIGPTPEMSLLPALLGADLLEAEPTGLIGVGVGSTNGDGMGLGGGADKEGAGLAPFGVPGGSGAGIKTSFIGLAGVGSRIVFVCDGTGSMGEAFGDLKRQLRKSIDALTPVQSFNVIFFQDGKALAMEANRLLVATPENQTKAHAFFEKINLRFGSNPIPALERAFAQKPQLIYLLTDGDFFDAESKTGHQEGNQAVVDFCRGQAAICKTRINTIAFLKKQKEGSRSYWESQDLVKAMEAIARDSGGKYKSVSEKEMGG